MRERERERERGGRERDQYKMYFNDLNEDKFSLLSFTFQIEVQQLFVYYMYISFHMYKYLIFNFFFLQNASEMLFFCFIPSIYYVKSPCKENISSASALITL